MSIQQGDQVPAGAFKVFGSDGMHEVTTDELFAGKKVVLFGVPGAFTPTCNDTHLPGFQTQADTLRERGVDTIACMAVNDPFVMAAWGRHTGAGEFIQMLSDGNGEYATSLGLTLDLSAVHMGERSARFAMVVDDGTVTYLGRELGRDVTVSGVDAVLEHL
ncbi:MAG: peroxiredoxin [Acidobacteriota bacterium]